MWTESLKGEMKILNNYHFINFSTNSNHLIVFPLDYNRNYKKITNFLSNFLYKTDKKVILHHVFLLIFSCEPNQKRSFIMDYAFLRERKCDNLLETFSSNKRTKHCVNGYLQTKERKETALLLSPTFILPNQNKQHKHF